MPRAIGSKNLGERIDYRQLSYRPHTKGARALKWHYDGKFVEDHRGERHLHITKVHGDFTGRAVELDKAIKAECRRLGATVHLDDRQAADEILFHMMPHMGDPRP